MRWRRWCICVRATAANGREEAAEARARRGTTTAGPPPSRCPGRVEEPVAVRPRDQAPGRTWSGLLTCQRRQSSPLPALPRLRIDHVDGLAGGPGEQALDAAGVDALVAFLLRVAEMRRAERVRHAQQRRSEERRVGKEGRAQRPPAPE